ncbi:MAG: glucose-6-phosphate dehydrogenase [Saccharofermentanales bacterium]
MKIPGCLMTIFGATGDLTHRKLIPALYQLQCQGLLPDDFSILAVGRRALTTRSYLEQIRQSVVKYSADFSSGVWNALENRIEYIRVDILNKDSFIGLAEIINKGRAESRYAGNDMFYLAVAPEYFAPIVNGLDSIRLIDHTPADTSDDSKKWQRFVIEKPFGKDLASASELNRSLTSVIPEESIYRIDHYLAKEMIQNITMLRSRNTIFEPLWNHNYIDNIQISILERDGVGSRGGYYDNSGALRDMVQNHLLQIVAVLAMDLTPDNKAEQIRDEKVRLLSSLKIDFKSDPAPVVLGQYRSYKFEEHVTADSATETFAALKVSVDNERWQGVPFYLVTGKKLSAKAALVSVEFKKPAGSQQDDIPANLLQIGIQPQEGIHLKLNMKKPTVTDEMDVAEMEYCQSCYYDFNSPDSYEKLLLDVMLGDSTRFTRWDELRLSWKLTDDIAEYCNRNNILDLYDDDSAGPGSAVNMIKAYGRRWWHLDEGSNKPMPFFCRTDNRRRQ